jgi:hypothetical protein
MKKVLITFLTIVLIPSFTTDAQEVNTSIGGEERNLIDFSFVFGFNFTGLSGDTDEFEDELSLLTGLDFDDKWRTFNVPAGFTVSANATGWLSFKTGAIYSPKGMKFTDNIDIYGDNYDIDLFLKLRYIEIPCLVEFNITTNRNSDLYISGGIAPSFLVNSRIVTKVTGPGDDDKEAEDWEDVNKFDLGYQIGTGFKTDDGYFGVQYVNGLKNVSSAGWDLTNITLSLIFGTYF